MEKATLTQIAADLALLIGLLAILVLLSAIVLKRAEKHMKESGNMVLY